MNINPYSVLNISEDATYEEIKQRYLHLSKNLHPDKHPIQNYHMAKQKFEYIDGAYKSISTPLRRYIFQRFGLKGISLIDDYPLEFKHFEEDNIDLNDKNVQKKIKDLIVYMLHEDHAMNQIDKSKLTTKSIINMSKVLRKNKKNITNPPLRIPQIQKNTFSYQMPLPDYYGFSNSVGVTHDVSGIQRAPSGNLDFTFVSMKRIRQNILVNGQVSINNQFNNVDLSADWILNTSTQVRFNPISVTNGVFNLPKIGIDKSFKDFSFSGITDFQHINFDISDGGLKGGNNKFSKSIKIVVQKNAVMIMPRIQYDLTKEVRLLIQLILTLQDQAFNINFNYGYKLKISQEYKIQLLSFTGSQNYFQISLQSPKFRVQFPLISESGGSTAVRDQLYKCIFLLGFFLAFKIFRTLSTSGKKQKKKNIQQEYNRLQYQKSSINKALNEVSTKAQQNHQKQIKMNGLIIIKAFLGHNKQIKKILQLAKKIKLKSSQKISISSQEYKIALQKQILSSNIKYGAVEDELYEITDLVRSFVKGSQIINKKIHQFQPLINPEDTPCVLAIYINRGSLGFYFQESKNIINIGGLNQNKTNLIKKIKTLIIDWIW